MRTLESKRALKISKGFFDLLFISLAWITAYGIRFQTIFSFAKGRPEFLPYLKLTPFIWLIFGFSFIFAGFYDKLFLRGNVYPQFREALKVVLFATAVFLSFTFFYEEFRYSRGCVLAFILLEPLALWLSRRSFQTCANILWKQKAKVLLIGAGETFRRSLKSLLDEPQMDLAHVVLLEEDPHAKDILRARHIDFSKPPTSWLDFFCKGSEFHLVLIAPPDESFLVHIDEIAAQTTTIEIIPPLHAYFAKSRHFDHLEIYAIPYEGYEQGEASLILKRGLDISGALVGLLLFSPFFAILSVLIKATSRGPVLYKQTRMGVDGRLFHMVKFRSMREDAEDGTGAVFARKGDDRTTPIGSFLRRTSLDEIPQFWNVLRGDMSLVGPRPERPEFVNKFRASIPGYMKRHRMKSGMTGWAQINGWRGDTSIDERVLCDLYYIQNWSLLLDIKILFLTIWRGFVHKNAY